MPKIFYVYFCICESLGVAFIMFDYNYRSSRVNDEEVSSKKSKSHHKKKDHKKKHKHEHKSKSSKHRDDSGGEKRKHKKRKHENGNMKGEKLDSQNVSYIDDGPAAKHMKLDENSLQVGL